MSSEVMTHENWARLHVARRVSDIAKSMIKLSRLGRSIFPTPSHPGPGGEEPAARLKVSGSSRPLHPAPAKAYPRNLECGLLMTARAPVIDALRASPDQVAAFRLSRITSVSVLLPRPSSRWQATWLAHRRRCCPPRKYRCGRGPGAFPWMMSITLCGKTELS